MAELDTSVRMDINQIEVRDTSIKQTPNNSFGQMMRAGAAGTVNTINGQLASAGYMIPGAAVVGAAVNGAGSVRDASGTSSSGAGFGGVSRLGTDSSGMLAGTGVGVSSAGASLGGSTIGSGSGDAALLSSGGGNSSQALLAATQQMTEMNQVFNLQYLGLQENMQKENREFSAVSNVMKSKNDTAKNSLSNLK